MSQNVKNDKNGGEDQQLLPAILSYLQQQGLNSSAQTVIREASACKVEAFVLKGQWDELESHLVGVWEGTQQQELLQFALKARRQRFLEAVEAKNKTEATRLFGSKLNILENVDPTAYHQLGRLLFSSVVDRKQLQALGYVDAATGRKILALEAKQIVESQQNASSSSGGVVAPSSGSMNPPLSYQAQNKMFGGMPQSAFQTHNQNQPRNPFGNNVGNPWLQHPQSSSMDPSMQAGRVLRPPNKWFKPRKYGVQDVPRDQKFTIELPQSATSLDFHPQHTTLLLVGTKHCCVNVVSCMQRDIALIVHCATKDVPEGTAVHCVKWARAGDMFGIGFSGISKGYVQVYRFWIDGNKCRAELLYELQAHYGKVNDIAFAHLQGSKFMMTSGGDPDIKVWDVRTGEKLHTLVGHTSEVISLCVAYRNGVGVIYSTSYDGTFKAWQYGAKGFKNDYSAPGSWCSSIVYSSALGRLWLCGYSANLSSLVEWDEWSGSVIRTYYGFENNSQALVKLVLLGNKFLVAIDDRRIKVWDVDDHSKPVHVQGLTDYMDVVTTALTRNMSCSLMAVNSPSSKITIFVSDFGSNLLKQEISLLCTAARYRADPTSFIVPDSSKAKPPQKEPMASKDAASHAPISQPYQESNISSDDSEHRMHDFPKAVVSSKDSIGYVDLPRGTYGACLAIQYFHSGSAIVGIGSEGTIQVWKWSNSEQDTVPCIGVSEYMPEGVNRMQNLVEAPESTLSEAYISISHDDRRLASSLGGQVLLHDLKTFKISVYVLKNEGTAVEFHPTNVNLLLVGTKDGRVMMYDQAKNTWEHVWRCHQGFVNGLSFSRDGDTAISSGQDMKLGMINCSREKKGVYEKRGVIGIPEPPPKLRRRNRNIPLKLNVQIHPQSNSTFLVTHPQQLLLYEVSCPEMPKKWNTYRKSVGSITDAAFSASGGCVHASFSNGCIKIFSTVEFSVLCQIEPEIIDPQQLGIYTICLHPHPDYYQASQLALGLSNGGLVIIQPPGGMASSWLISPQTQAEGASSSSLVDVARLLTPESFPQPIGFFSSPRTLLEMISTPKGNTSKMSKLIQEQMINEEGKDLEDNDKLFQKECLVQFLCKDETVNLEIIVLASNIDTDFYDKHDDQPLISSASM